jgi:hypothetical protein
MDIVDMAHASGFTVILDGRIGREEYQSVCGSVSALQRFAEAVRQDAASQRESAPLQSPAADLEVRENLAAGRRLLVTRRTTLAGCWHDGADANRSA